MPSVFFIRSRQKRVSNKQSLWSLAISRPFILEELTPEGDSWYGEQILFGSEKE